MVGGEQHAREYRDVVAAGGRWWSRYAESGGRLLEGPLALLDVRLLEGLVHGGQDGAGELAVGRLAAHIGSANLAVGRG